jgi:subfamily B ATP-binding cassette protein MsbA
VSNQSQTSRELYLRLLRYVFPYWKVLAVSLSLLALLAATEPVFPALMQPLLDEGFTNRNESFIRWIPIALVALFLFRGALTFTASYASSWVAGRLVADLRNEMFAKLVELPVRFFDQKSSARLSSHIAYDVHNLTSAATTALTVIVRDSLTIVGLMAWLLWLDWKLTTVTLILFPFIALIVRYFNKRLRKVSSENQYAMADITHHVEEASTNNRIIKTFTAEDFEKERFRYVNERQRGLNMRSIVASSAVTPLVQLLASLSVAIVVGIALNNPTNTTASAGGFMSFLTALLMLLPPTKRLTDVTSVIQRGLAAAEVVFSLIDEAPEKLSTSEHDDLHLKGKIEFKDVSFSYPGENKLALKQLNLAIPAGERLALVGKSGSGKSTITSLIAGFYTKTHGEIFLDQTPIQQIPLASIRKNIALVSQDVRLFNNSVLFNVAYGDPTPDLERAQKALSDAHALEFVSGLSEGIHTQLGQNGVKLSGGQRQRIAIARAFYKNAPILILDEATSSLDTESERNIQLALEKLMEGRTSIVVAHRLSTIEHADRIAVLADGQIQEIGSHNELIRHSGAYARLHQLQEAGSL